MILITGGLGFIGLNTARALLELGEECVLTQHQVARRPDFIKAALGKQVFIEQVDITDLSALLEIGKRHNITHIIHLGGPGIGALDLFENLRVSMQMLFNVVEAAKEWGVKRVSIASAIGVYIGIQDNPFREEVPLPMSAVHPIQTVKKSSELFATFVGNQTGIEVVNMRIGAIWGPLGRAQSSFFLTPRLVHAAVKGETLDFSLPQFPPYAEDGLDMCYVKDCGRAIALLQTTPKLNYSTYNIGSGYATSNNELVQAVKKVIPEIKIELAEGYDPRGAGQRLYLDTTRLRQDTGFEPTYTIESGIADYIDWLRKGNER
ncbi:MAG TPA: NAD(P)-dependent oxidoreductase [Chloroflexia bacterium]|nr:NAD(P)-dependent oxidoreductase [Chloroflexia bacterium]